MKIPEKIVDCIEMLLEPYPISFKEMLARYLSASPEEEEEEEEEEWVTLQAAADFAKISTWTVRRWCHQGGLVFRKTSTARCGRIRISKASLKEFINKLGQ